jgi:methylase of polypeptide subunit release factors
MIRDGFGSDEQFATLRQILIDSGYLETAICQRAAVTRLDEILMSPERRATAPPLQDTLDALIWVLLEGRPLRPQVAREILPTGLPDLLAEFGLLVQSDSGWMCPIALYPTEDLYLISDRSNDAVDSVYPAIEANSRRFLDVIPRSNCGSFLDLCTGTGIAALVAARDFAATAFACDLGDRAAEFAEFNRRLNGLANLKCEQGDLYQPYEGRVFDCIVSHPPHVPVLKPKHLFSDGGDDGEQVGRSIVQGLPAHLAPGGQFCLLAMGADTKEAPFERRARAWLGDAQQEFDIALVARKFLEPDEFITASVMRGSTELSQVPQWKAMFRNRGVTDLVYGTLLMCRKTESRAPFTVRRQTGETTHRRAEMDWLLRWERAIANGAGASLALNSRLAAAPGSELRVINHLKNGNWAAKEYRLQVDYPFHVECRTQPWILHLLSLCDGSKTGTQQLKTLISEGMVARGTSPEQFAQALTLLISEGFLQFASGNSIINSI